MTYFNNEENEIIEKEKRKNEEKNIKKVFQNNICYLLEKADNKQEFYARKIGISPSTLSDYKAGRAYPSKFRILNNISHCFRVSIDDLLNCDLSKEDTSVEGNILLFGNKMYNNFLHKDFWIYYFKTKVHMPVEINEGRLNVKVNEIGDGYNLDFRIVNSDYLYNGNLVLTRDNIYMYFRRNPNNERALMILKLPPVFNRKTNKNYIGGIGLIVSLSKGNETVPCMQKALISDVCIPIKDCENELVDILSFKEGNSKVVRLNEKDETIAYDFIKKHKNNIGVSL